MAFGYKSKWLLLVFQEGASSTVLQNCDNQIDEFVKENSEDEFLRIRMLSNDIRQSPIEDVHIITEDDQEGNVNQSI